MTYGVLMHPQKPEQLVGSVTQKQAVDFANRLLSESGMSDYKVFENEVHLDRGYFFCPYVLVNDPNVRSGGGAALLVRQRDGLCAMLYINEDWVFPNLEDRFKQIEDAFQAFDRNEEAEHLGIDRKLNEQ